MAEERVNKDALRNVIKTHSLFKDAGADFWNEAQQWFQGQTLDAQQVLYEKGDSSDTIYFIARGSMDFLDEDGSILRQVPIIEYFNPQQGSSGSYFL